MREHVGDAAAAELLVRLSDDDDRPAQRAARQHRLERRDERRQAALGVAGAATIQAPVLEARIERIDLHAVDWHRVEMRRDQQRRVPIARRSCLCHDAGARTAADHRGIEPEPLELRRDVLGVTAFAGDRVRDIVALHRIHRWNRDVVAQQRNAAGERSHRSASASSSGNSCSSRSLLASVIGCFGSFVQ